MVEIIIKNKTYSPISTVIDGRTIRIPSKNKSLKMTVKKITDHLEELQKANKIQVIKKR